MSHYNQQTRVYKSLGIIQRKQSQQVQSRPQFMRSKWHAKCNQENAGLIKASQTGIQYEYSINNI